MTDQQSDNMKIASLFNEYLVNSIMCRAALENPEYDYVKFSLLCANISIELCNDYGIKLATYDLDVEYIKNHS